MKCGYFITPVLPPSPKHFHKHILFKSLNIIVFFFVLFFSLFVLPKSTQTLANKGKSLANVLFARLSVFPTFWNFLAE